MDTYIIISEVFLGFSVLLVLYIIFYQEVYTPARDNYLETKELKKLKNNLNEYDRIWEIKERQLMLLKKGKQLEVKEEEILKRERLEEKESKLKLELNEEEEILKLQKRVESEAKRNLKREERKATGLQNI